MMHFCHEVCFSCGLRCLYYISSLTVTRCEIKRVLDLFEAKVATD